jgi:DNA repair photolyase
VSDKIIYAPKGQAGEYAPLAINIYRGCGHRCCYCWVPQYTHMSRAEFDAGAVPRKGFSIEQLRKEAAQLRAAEVTDQILLSFSTDPYHPGHPGGTVLTRETLIVLCEYGLGFCLLTKGGTRALRDIDLYRPTKDAFAVTLTSLSNTFSQKWERNAPLPSDRIAALKAFFESGIFTWVSLEPTLHIEVSLAIVRATHEFVDLYKVGRANYCGTLTKQTDWRTYTLRMIDLLTQLGKAHYIKQDLQPYLPPGYHNPLRVPQHH